MTKRPKHFDDIDTLIKGVKNGAMTAEDTIKLVDAEIKSIDAEMKTALDRHEKLQKAKRIIESMNKRRRVLALLKTGVTKEVASNRDKLALLVKEFRRLHGNGYFVHAGSPERCRIDRLKKELQDMCEHRFRALGYMPDDYSYEDHATKKTRHCLICGEEFNDKPNKYDFGEYINLERFLSDNEGNDTKTMLKNLEKEIKSQ